MMKKIYNWLFSGDDFETSKEGIYFIGMLLGVLFLVLILMSYVTIIGTMKTLIEVADDYKAEAQKLESVQNYYSKELTRCQTLLLEEE